MAELPEHLSRRNSELLGRRRRGRNIAMLVVLVGVVVLFYVLAIVKLTPGHLTGP